MSGLDKQVVGINFAQGMETREDERLVIPGKLLDVQNLSLSESGALTRRDGWAPLNATAASALNGLATFNDELLAVNGSSLSAYAAGNGALYSRGVVSPLTLTKETVQRSTGFQDETDCASSGKYSAYVWRDYAADQTTINGIYYTIRDEVSGTVIVAATAATTSATAYCPRVVFVEATAAATDEDMFVLIWADAANIKTISVPTSSFSASATTTVAGSNHAGTSIDAIGRDGLVLLFWSSTNGTTSAFINTIYYSGGSPADSSVAVLAQADVPVAGISGLTLAAFAAAGRIGLYVSGGAPGVWGAVYDTTTGTVTAAAALLDATAPVGGTNRITATAVGANITVFHDSAAAFNTGLVASQVPLRRLTVNGVNAIQSGPTTIINSNTYVGGQPQGPFIAAKAFTANGAAYLPVHVGSVSIAVEILNLQCTWFLLDADARIMAKALYGTYGLWSFSGATPVASTPASTPMANGTIIVPVGERGFASLTTDALGGIINLTPIGMSRLLLAFNATTSPISATVGGNVFFAGGFLAAYDGSQAVEAGFHLFPEGLTVADGAAGSVTAGSHQYVAMYEWVDAQGQRHQSSPGTPFTHVAAGGKKAIVHIPTLLMTAKTGVNIVVCRTAVNGTTFKRLNAQNQPIANVASAGSVAYTDDAADASLSGEELYTDGGALDNRGPPSCSSLAVHQNRLFLGGLEDPHEFRYSQARIQGVGLQWNPTLSATVDATAGGIVAIKSMDEKLALFCERRPYVLFGTGPTSAGLQNGYQLDEVTSDVGCSEPRSVLKMPTGIIFKASKGWHLFDRGLQIKYIGSGVEAFNANDVSAAVLLEDRKEARFYSSSGTTLVYSYLSVGQDGVGQWERYLGQAAVDAVWYPTDEAVAWATAAGSLNEDTPGAYKDNGAAIVTLFDTGWLKPGAALHGFERVYQLLLAGPYSTSGSLTLTAFYDYDDGTGESITFFGPTGAGFATGESDDLTVSPTSALIGAGGNTWEFRWRLPRQKCQAIRFRITETPSGGALAGLGFSSMSLEVGIKRGAYKLPAARSG